MNDKLKLVRLVAMDMDGTFTDGTLYYDSGGNVMKGFAAQDGLGLELLRRAGIKRGFITGRHDNASEARASYLGVDFFLSGIGDKAESLNDTLEQFSLSPEECLYIGDDFNDIPAFEIAGVSVAVANAPSELKHLVDYVTERPGGHGAVREVVHMLLRARGIDPVAAWMTEPHRGVGKQ